MNSLIRSAILNQYVEVSTSVGIDPFKMLRSVGLSPACLSDPDTMISARAVGRLLEESARAAGVEDFGLRIGMSRSLSNLGPLSLLIRQEPTLRAALDSLTRYIRVHNEAFHIWVEVSGDVALIREELLMEGPLAVRQLMELSVAALHRMLKELLGNQWQPKRMCFAHSAPAELSSYWRAFGVRLEFDSEFNGAMCAARDLDVPISSSDLTTARYARQYLDSLVHEPSASDPAMIRHLIIKLLPLGQCGVKQVAHLMEVDRRTLHRHLALHSETFSSVLSKTRSELAVRHLADGRRSMEDVAVLLGFSSRTSFSRWFRSAFGQTVGEWRNAAKSSWNEARSGTE